MTPYPPTNIKMKFLQAGIKDKGVFLLFINNTSQITKLNINHSVTRKKITLPGKKENEHCQANHRLTFLGCLSS